MLSNYEDIKKKIRYNHIRYKDEFWQAWNQSFPWYHERIRKLPYIGDILNTLVEMCAMFFYRRGYIDALQDLQGD